MSGEPSSNIDPIGVCFTLGVFMGLLGFGFRVATNAVRAPFVVGRTVWNAGMALVPPKVVDGSYPVYVEVPAPQDGRQRGTCPACMEMMLVGASVCPHCRTTGVTWPGDTPKPVDIARPSTTFEEERIKHKHNQEKGIGSFPCPVCGAERTRIKGNPVNPCGSCGTRKY